MEFNSSEIEKLYELVADLFWDYDRMSSCGQKTLDKIGNLLKIPKD